MAEAQEWTRKADEPCFPSDYDMMVTVGSHGPCGAILLENVYGNAKGGTEDGSEEALKKFKGLHDKAKNASGWLMGAVNSVAGWLVGDGLNFSVKRGLSFTSNFFVRREGNGT